MKLTLEQFKAQFRAVDPHEAAAREPNKYFDPFTEGEK